jgi:hypothetical protein
MKGARRWLRRHPVYAVLLGLLFFVFISLPPYLADTWALVSDRPLFTYIEEKVGVPPFSIGWVTVPAGLTGILVIIGLLVTGRRDEVSQAEHERIVNGLNNDIAGLKSKLEEEANKSKSAQSELSSEKKKYEWLHTISQNQRNAINGYVRVLSCEIIKHDFLEELYVDFKFTVLNGSVYTICIEDSIKGDVKLGERLLSKGAKIILNDATYFKPNEVKDFVVRQWLDRDEIADILRATDDAREFRLHGLDITIQGNDFDEIKVSPRRLTVYNLKLSSEPLRELSQKLRVEIRRAYLKGYWIFSKGMQIGSQVNVQISIENARTVDIEVREFRLTIKFGSKEYTRPAEGGDIYETHHLEENGEIKKTEPRLENLNTTPNVIGKGQRMDDNWLKFIFHDLIPRETETYSARLTIIDSIGEEHSKECSLKYE